MLLALTFVVGGTSRAATDAGDQCAVAKLKAAAKKATKKLACHTAAIKKGEPVDADCLAKAEEKFVAAFAKAEAKGGCRTIDDAGTVETHVDACVSQLVTDEPAACANGGQDCSTLACCPNGAFPIVCQGGVCCGPSGALCGGARPPCCSGSCVGGICQ